MTTKNANTCHAAKCRKISQFRYALKQDASNARPTQAFDYCVLHGAALEQSASYKTGFWKVERITSRSE
jgi:hypothetical protein